MEVIRARRVKGKDSKEMYAEKRVSNHISSACGNGAKASGRVHKIQACKNKQLALI